MNEGVTCDIQNSVAYDVIEVKLSKSQPEQSHRVMLHLKYTELQRCLPSHVTLSCGRFFIYGGPAVRNIGSYSPHPHPKMPKVALCLAYAVHYELCSKTIEIYIHYLHFQGFFMPKKLGLALFRSSPPLLSDFGFWLVSNGDV